MRIRAEIVGNIFTPIMFKPHFWVILICLFFARLSFGQTANAPSGDSVTIMQNQPLQYVKIEVGMHILDCPVLPPQLKEKLMGVKGIRDYTVNRKDETILFAVPEGVITKEQIVAAAVRCGFPVSAVNVIMGSKPFTN